MAHGTNAAFDLFRVRDAAQSSGHHIAVFECRNKLASLAGIVPQPVQQLREAPFRRIHAAAPFDGFEFFAVRCFRNFRSFLFGAMVAPQIVVVERLEILPNGNHRRARGIQRNGENLLARDSGFLQNFTRGRSQRPHVIGVRLRGEFRIVALAMERICGDGRCQQAALTVHQRNADVQSPKINPSNDGHPALRKKNSPPTSNDNETAQLSPLG